MYQKIFYFLFKCLIFSTVLLLSGCSNKPNEYKSIKFIVQIKKPLINQKIYLAGNCEKLGNWNPAAIPMDKQSDTIWTKSISFKEGDKIEYKITKGTWKSEAVNEDGWIFDNFKLNIINDTTIKTVIPKWKDNLYYRRIVKANFEEPNP